MDKDSVIKTLVQSAVIEKLVVKEVEKHLPELMGKALQDNRTEVKDIIEDLLDDHSFKMKLKDTLLDLLDDHAVRDKIGKIR